jgi:2',3'-cyclic-nucleotide 2'-phosphodiesterase (5'-nucleotidase family)
MRFFSLITLAAVLRPALPCDDHDWTSPILGGYVDHGLMKKHDLAKRIQPTAQSTPAQQIKDIHWGQINFLHTTDTHGWLAGHLLDDNYSADYGDFADFMSKMKAKADVYGVDLLLVDSGDLHDGTGFGDATKPNGKLTLPVFEKLPYDLLSIGNHELYTTEIANDTYHNFAPRWGGRYVTSNVDFNLTGKPVPFSNRYAYWKSKQGIRVMAFAFIFNFTGNSNATVVTPVGEAVKQSWFQQQVKRTDIDMFVVAGHITLRNSTEWGLIYAAIRAYHPSTPIQIFGGHRHVRDTVVFDSSALGIASGRYCETLGWVSVNGLPKNVTKAKSPMGSATKITQTPSAVPGVKPYLNSTLSYSRQYLDFNRYSFEFHTGTNEQTFNTTLGVSISKNITAAVGSLPQLVTKLGCVPDSYYLDRFPISSNRSLFNYLTNVVFPAVVFDPNRSTTPRIILTNTGGFRYDLLKGPFTIDNAYQVNPYTNYWQRMTAPWSEAKNLLLNMQTDKVYKRATPVNATTLTVTPGYVTKDDLGSDGDNIVHTNQGYSASPHYVQANVSVSNITDDTLVDVYVTSFFAAAAAKYLPSNTSNWINADGNFSSFDTLPRMASLYWGKNC